MMATRNNRIRGQGVKEAKLAMYHLSFDSGISCMGLCQKFLPLPETIDLFARGASAWLGMAGEHKKAGEGEISAEEAV